MGGEVRLYPDRLGKVPRTGAVDSVQGAELDVREPVSRLLTPAFLQWAAAEYWRLITRFTLGLIRVRSDGQDQCVVLLVRPLVMLRFHSSEYDLDGGGGSVTWRIKRGILVSREGRDQGFLRLSLAPIESPGGNGQARVSVRMEVHNFYPWLRGSGPFARVGVWIYAQTQQRIHRVVTRRFLRRLAEFGGEGP
jgi:hypothetical protein